jgi:hypothetical protein
MIGIGRLSTLLKAASAALIYNFIEKRGKKIHKQIIRKVISLAVAKLKMHVCDIQTSGSSMITGLTPTAYNGRIL